MTAATVLRDAHVDAWRASRGLPLAPIELTPAQKADFERLADYLIGKGVRAAMATQSAMDKALQRGEFAPDGVNVIRGNAVTVERVEWLWKGYLPRGKLVLTAGPAGVSKTTLVIAIAATITQAGRWPDNTRAEAGDVLIWSGEDGVSDTLLPRLIAHGADLERVFFVRDVTCDGERRPFDPSTDMDDLMLAATRIPKLRLVIIDPVILAVRGDSNTNGDVRRGLQPLVQLAERTGAAAIGVTHFTKNTSGRHPVERVTGSLAFAAAARVVLAVSKLPDEEGGGRVVLRAKNNLGPDGGGFRFGVRPVDVAGTEAVLIEWGEAITGSAHDILDAAERRDDPGERTAGEAVVEFLRECLADGPMDRRDLLVAAKNNGFHERAIERARNRVGVTVRQSGFGNDRRSVWALAAQSRHEAPAKNMVKNDGYDGNDGIGKGPFPSIPPISTTSTGTREGGGHAAPLTSSSHAYRRASRGE